MGKDGKPLSLKGGVTMTFRQIARLIQILRSLSLTDKEIILVLMLMA